MKHRIRNRPFQPRNCSTSPSKSQTPWVLRTQVALSIATSNRKYLRYEHGQAKVLDFGLAKIMKTPRDSASERRHSRHRSGISEVNLTSPGSPLAR